MDISDALVCLSKIDKSNLHETEHFTIRIRQRKDHMQSDTNEIYAIILNEKPVGILKQDDEKFKLCYELDRDYDLTIIISIRNSKPLTINLVTCYKEKSKKRGRKDGEKVESK